MKLEGQVSEKEKLGKRVEPPIINFSNGINKLLKYGSVWAQSC